MRRGIELGEPVAAGERERIGGKREIKVIDRKQK